MLSVRGWLALALLGLLLGGCASQPSFVDPLPEFHEARPRSILVVPIVNHSVAVQAPTYVLSTLSKVIGERGYYVFPVNTVKTLLEYEGLYEAAEVHAEAVGELAELFGADAVLYVTVHEWRAEYVLLKTTTYVDLEYRLVGSSGTDLWQARKRLSYSPETVDAGSGVANLLSAAITAAFERADPNYLPLTRKANSEVFMQGSHAWPPGPYAHSYLTYYQKLEQAKAAQ